jgi:hypothetical protein
MSLVADLAGLAITARETANRVRAALRGCTILLVRAVRRNGLAFALDATEPGLAITARLATDRVQSASQPRTIHLFRAIRDPFLAHAIKTAQADLAVRVVLAGLPLSCPIMFV